MSRTYYCHNASLYSKDCEVSTPPNERRHYHYTTCTPDRAQWFQHDAFLHGDYCGMGATARANATSLDEEYGALDGVAYWHDYGSHGSKWVWFDIELERDDCREEWRALKTTLDALDDYPIIDEIEWSTAEMDEQIEAWGNFGANDFRSILRKLAPHHDALIDAIPDVPLSGVWSQIADSECGGEECIHEQGGPYFPFSSVFGDRAAAHKRWTWTDVRPLLIECIHDHRAWLKSRPAADDAA